MGDWSKFNQDSTVTYGSSHEFEKMIRDERPDLSVPEHHITMVEHGVGWCPADETPPRPDEPCGRCFGRIRRGSNLYCPKCGDSGYERELYEQRRLAGEPIVTNQMGNDDGLRGGTK